MYYKKYNWQKKDGEIFWFTFIVFISIASFFDFIYFINMQYVTLNNKFLHLFIIVEILRKAKDLFYGRNYFYCARLWHNIRQSTCIANYFSFYPIWTLLQSRPDDYSCKKLLISTRFIVYMRNRALMVSGLWLNASWICTRRYRFKCRVLVSPNLPSNAVNPLKYQWHLPTTDMIMRGINPMWLDDDGKLSSNYRDSMIRNVLISSE